MENFAGPQKEFSFEARKVASSLSDGFEFCELRHKRREVVGSKGGLVCGRIIAKEMSGTLKDRQGALCGLNRCRRPGARCGRKAPPAEIHRVSLLAPPTLVVGAAAPAWLSGPVKQFVDIEGASGAKYRFQRVDDAGQTPSKAGNVVILRSADDKDEVVICGIAENLQRAVAVWGADLQPDETNGIFVRLHVTRATRINEHEDIVARHTPELVLNDVD